MTKPATATLAVAKDKKEHALYPKRHRNLYHLARQSLILLLCILSMQAFLIAETKVDNSAETQRSNASRFQLTGFEAVWR